MVDAVVDAVVKAVIETGVKVEVKTGVEVEVETEVEVEVEVEIGAGGCLDAFEKVLDAMVTVGVLIAGVGDVLKKP